jgi:hypothetical protein
VILIASAVVYLRVLVEIAVVAPALLVRAIGPLVLMFLLLTALSAVRAWRHPLPQDGEPADHGNPTQLRAALLFGAIYALVVLAAAWAKAQFGSKGLYTVAGISGLVDLEAITLSSAQLVRGASSRPTLRGGWCCSPRSPTWRSRPASWRCGAACAAARIAPVLGRRCSSAPCSLVAGRGGSALPRIVPARPRLVRPMA